MSTMAISLLAVSASSAYGGVFGSVRAPPIRAPASPTTATMAPAATKSGPRFRLPSLPSHLVLPAVSYASLAATTAGALVLLQPYAWPGVALVGYSVGFPFALVAGQAMSVGGAGIAKSMGGQPTDDPRLRQLAADAAAAVGVPAPAVFEIKSKEPNAFATSSLFAKDPAVAVTTGLREILTDDEVGAVLAHEMGHLRHRDVLRNMHVAAAAAGLGGIYEVGRVLVDMSTREKKSKSKKDKDDDSSGAGVGVALMAAGLVTQSAAHGLRLMASRDAEIKADRAAAEAYGANTMIRALEKIDEHSRRRPADLRASKGGKAFAFAMISDGPAAKPSLRVESGGGVFGAAGRFFNRVNTALRTHPTLDKRVEALEAAAAAGLVPAGNPTGWW